VHQPGATIASPSIQNMGEDHRGAHIPVPEQVLNRPDVVAVFE
jgi:hypothetical protein